MRRLSAVLPLIFALLSACDAINDPKGLAAEQIRGNWAFNRVTTSGCAPDLTLTITELREVTNVGFNLGGTWTTVEDPVPRKFVGGNVNTSTGAFTVEFTASPNQRIEGIMNANSTATAFWHGGNCTQELAGVRQ